MTGTPGITGTPRYRSTVPSRGDGFAAILRAEWTKFRSVRSTVVCLGLVVVLTVLLSTLFSAVGSTDANDGPHYVDQFSFVHQPMTGDGSITARVQDQQDSQEWAKAGLIVKAGTGGGSTYAAVMVTPRHGVRMQATFTQDLSGSQDQAARWLRLTRTGSSITGFSSADGISWQRIGTITLDGLPRTAEVGLLVSSPPQVVAVKVPGGSSIRYMPTVGRASFDQVSLRPTAPAPAGRWEWVDVGAQTDAKVLGPQAVGGFTPSGGTFAVTGAGDISGYGIPGFTGDAFGDDIVVNSLLGVQIGLIAVIALGVIFAAAEYKTNLVWVTYTASPRRGRVLLAKAVVVGTAVFAAGLVASVAAFLLTQPGMHRNGFAPPAYPYRSLAEAPVLCAVVGTALVLAVMAVFSLGVGTLLRRSARALALLVGLVVVPQIVGSAVPWLNAQKWLDRITPVAGLAIQHTRSQFDTAIGPWAGFAVLCAYAAVALVAAIVLVRRRDA
jgi:ABC-type transport system involved in multi-copper enzyme maturation permease subunit